TTFCIGGSVVLNGTTGAGNTYQWNKAGTPITGATLATYTANATGAYTISITNTLGCVATSPVVNVVDGIVGTLTHTTALEFCKNDHVLLKANTGGVTGSIGYEWKLNGTTILAATDSTYSATLSGIYTASISVSG